MCNCVLWSVYAYAYMFKLCMHTFICFRVCVHVSMCCGVCIHMCAHVCICVHVSTCFQVCPYVFRCVNVSICLCMCLEVISFMCVPMSICFQVCLYIHMCTCVHVFSECPHAFRSVACCSYVVLWWPWPEPTLVLLFLLSLISQWEDRSPGAPRPVSVISQSGLWGTQI